MHIGDFTAKTEAAAARSGELTRFLLKTMEPGDILTHLCTPNAGRVLDPAGQPFPEVAVVRMTTARPASVLGMAGEIGALAVGRDADITIIDLAEGDFSFTDTTGSAFRGGYGLVPVHTLRAGQSHSPHWGTHPWGWLPARS